jgi:hypothetical protein
VDGAGDVFIADTNNRRVVEVPAGGGTQTTVSNELDFPEGVAVDGAGDVFIADTRNNFVLEVPVGGAVGSGLSYPTAVAVDGAGDVFIADNGNNRVVEVQRSQPPAFSFAATVVGNTSTDSPQSVTIQNIGNQPLNAVTPGLVVGGPNFLQVAGSGTPPDCTGAFALTPGAACNLSISFEPQSVGPLTSTAVFTDNALNASPSATQSVTLQGTGTPIKIATSTYMTIYDATTGLPWSGTEGAGASSYATAAVIPGVGGGPAPTGTVGYTMYGNGTCTGAGSESTVTMVSGVVPNSSSSGPLAAGSYSFVASYSGDTNYSSSSSVCAPFSVNKAPTATAVVSSVNPSTAGQSVTFTATVGGGYSPNGTVGFTSNSMTISGCSAVPLSSGAAQCTTSTLPLGTDAIVATYSGDNNNVTSTGALPGGQQVNAAAVATTTTLSSSQNPSFTSPPNNSVAFSSTVTYSGSTPVTNGTVTFTDNGSPIASCSTVPLNGFGQAQCATSFTTEGTNNITATYNGTVNYLTSNGTVSQIVNNHTVQTGNQFCNQGPIAIPSTAGAATPYPSNIFVAGLSGNIGELTISLNNISSSNIQQTDMLLVGPTGTAIVPFANVGDMSTISGVNITLDDAGNGLIPGGSPLTNGTYQPTSKTASTSLVFPSPAPTVAAGNYAATDGAATLTSTFQNSAPNGTWALYAMDNSGSGAASIGGGWCLNITPATLQITITTSPANLLVSVDGGTATPAPLVENWTAGSSHTIATTSPQAGGAGVQYVWSSWSDGLAISHMITVPATATTYTAAFNTQYLLTTAANPTNGGTVTPASGTYYAAGAIVPLTAMANTGYAFSSWTGSVANPGSASTTVTMSAPETVTANFAASATPTTTTLMSSENPSTYGQSVTFSVSVTSNNGTPNGNVNFKNGTTSLGTVKLVSGSASLTASALNAGSRTITARYSGSTKYATSSATLTQTVDKVATTTTITNASPSPSTYGQPVTFTATVSTTAGSASGKVEFKRGTVALGSGTLSGGVASYTTTATQIPGGEDAITAVYNGDANHDAGTSTAYTQTVNKEATTTLVITSGSPSTFGNPVTFTATVSASVGTPAGNVAFTDGTTLLGTMALSGGTAQFTTSALAVGTHTIHADYHGNGNYTISSGKVTQVVDP